MKDITVSVDDEVYRRTALKAEQAGTSVAGLVRSWLSELTRDAASESEFDRLKKLQGDTVAAIRGRGAGLRARENASRDALYDRDASR